MANGNLYEQLMSLLKGLKGVDAKELDEKKPMYSLLKLLNSQPDLQNLLRRLDRSIAICPSIAVPAPFPVPVWVGGANVNIRVNSTHPSVIHEVAFIDPDIDDPMMMGYYLGTPITLMTPLNPANDVAIMVPMVSVVKDYYFVLRVKNGGTLHSTHRLVVTVMPP